MSAAPMSTARRRANRFPRGGKRSLRPVHVDADTSVRATPDEFVRRGDVRHREPVCASRLQLAHEQCFGQERGNDFDLGRDGIASEKSDSRVPDAQWPVRNSCATVRPRGGADHRADGEELRIANLAAKSISPTRDEHRESLQWTVGKRTVCVDPGDTEARRRPRCSHRRSQRRQAQGMAMNPSTQYATDRNLASRQRLWWTGRRVPEFDLFSWVLDLAGITQGSTQSVLDVGCGNGAYRARPRRDGAPGSAGGVGPLRRDAAIDRRCCARRGGRSGPSLWAGVL